jgi:hypothetical protein
MNQLILEKTQPSKPHELINPYEINGYWIFAGICLVYLFSTYYLQTSLLTEQTYYNSLSGQMSDDKIEEMYKLKERLGTFSYFLVPLTTFIKILLPALCLHAVSILKSIDLPFRNAFKIALIAEAAFVVATLIRLLLLEFFVDIESFDQIRSFAPLSLLNLFNYSSVPPYLVYALQTINVFEIFYCILLATGLSNMLRKKFKPMIILAVSGYGIGLFFWVVLISFLGVASK